MDFERRRAVPRSIDKTRKTVQIHRYMDTGKYYLYSFLLILLVSCVIMQKNGAGLHTAASCFWDSTTDGI